MQELRQASGSIAGPTCEASGGVPDFECAHGVVDASRLAVDLLASEEETGGINAPYEGVLAAVAELHDVVFEDIVVDAVSKLGWQTEEPRGWLIRRNLWRWALATRFGLLAAWLDATAA